MSNSLTAEITDLLRPSEGLDVIICVGNPMRSDDGVGPYIASKIAGSPRLKIFDAGYTPENIIDEVKAVKPDRIIFIDAADFRGKAGEIRMIGEEEIPESGLSTHAIPLKVICGILRADTGSDVRFIGIQPADVSFSEKMSSEVKGAADLLIAKINGEFSHA